MLTNLEYLKEFVKNGKVADAEKYPFHYPPAIAKTLGFTLAEVGEGSAVIELQAKPEVHGNAMGTLHGGVLCDITDAAIGTAHATIIAPCEVIPVWICRLISFVRCGTKKSGPAPKPFIEAKLLAVMCVMSPGRMAN